MKIYKKKFFCFIIFYLLTLVKYNTLSVKKDRRNNFREDPNSQNTEMLNITNDLKNNENKIVNDWNYDKTALGSVIKDANMKKQDKTNSSIKDKIKENTNNEVNNEIQNDENYQNSSFLNKFKEDVNTFLSNPIETLKKMLDEMTSPFIKIYNSLAEPDTSKVEHDNYYSELLHMRLLPIAKTTLFILIILISIGIIIFLSFSLTSFLSKIKTDNIVATKNYHSSQEQTLRGRIKRMPNNINYNELFVETNNKKDKDSNITKLKDANSKNFEENLDDFFQKVKEKSEFERIFNGESKSIKDTNNHLSKENEKKDLNIKHENLLIFDQPDIKNEKLIYKNKLENLLNLSDVKDNTQKVKIDNFIEKKPNEKLYVNDKIDIDNEDSIRIENKMKNSDIFYQTPLARIRENSLSKR